ncbi:MAG: hypothetical protein IT258_01020 [Saprospiraceae bacterium]|nr:hypothetical protein [Saprospiraceae bacterium]
MKHLISLLFLSLALVSFGQKALTASLHLQNSGHHLGNDELINGSLITRYYNTAQIPTVSLAYMHFGYLGGYVRWQLSGWRYQRIVDEVSSYNPATGLYSVNRGTTIRLASGSIGFARGVQLAAINESRIILEFALTAGWRLADYSPFTSQEYPRKIFTTATQAGPNIVLHRVFDKGYIRFAGLLPIFQFKTESYHIEDPSLPASANRRTSSYVSGDGWRNAGVEIGGGLYISKK